jgi:hypothetical protein
VAVPIDIVPTVADVAALLRARTKDVNGEEIGTFNDDTRPTSSQAITLIDEAVADIQARMGPSPPMDLAGVNVKALSTFMGHANIRITLDQYGHLLPGAEDEAAGLLDAFLARQLGGADVDPTAAQTAAHPADSAL